MRAIISTKYESPNVLELKEVEKPVPRNDEVLVKILPTALFRPDPEIIDEKLWTD